MSTADIVSPAGQTVLRDTKSNDCGHGGHTTHHMDHGCHGRSRGCDDDGFFHELAGQHRTSVQVGDQGRFTDAGIALLLKNMNDNEGRSADRTQALGLMLVKESGDSKAALLAQILEAKVAAARDTLEARFALAKEVCETRNDLGRQIAEARMDCEKGRCAIESKICDLRSDVATSLKEVLRDAAESRREHDRLKILELETRLHCRRDRRDGDEGHGH